MTWWSLHRTANWCRWWSSSAWIHPLARREQAAVASQYQGTEPHRRRTQIDIVHGYEDGPALELALGPHRKFGTPLVITFLSMSVPSQFPRMSDSSSAPQIPRSTNRNQKPLVSDGAADRHRRELTHRGGRRTTAFRDRSGHRAGRGDLPHDNRSRQTPGVLERSRWSTASPIPARHASRRGRRIGVATG